ncbi:MAG: sugar ABC transporter ATP-binding protein [Chloroflexi bacterium]|nr:sugar ABC transporter ATP-binding protein [Chloroflexota bacterium]
MSLLRLENISKAYPGVQALRTVSFEIQAGCVHALVGENGAGKSTLIKILSGAEQPDAGHLWLDGQPYRPRQPKDALAANISTIYQMFNLMPDRTVAQNVLLGKEPHTRLGFLDRNAMRAQTRDILNRLGASHLPPDALVGGLKVSDKQILEIARALLNRSRLVIMDEPTSALNQNEAAALFEMIARLKAEGVTVLYVSHRLDEIFQLADAVTVLRDGRHISTQPLAAMTRDSLIQDMIGRKLTGVFPNKAQPGSETVLRVEGLTVNRLLHDVSFSLRRGEVLAVAGLSGSGKTELGKALFGDLPLDRGQIIFQGKPFTPTPGRAIRHGLMYLPEDRKTEGVMPELSVRRNIAMASLERVANGIGFIKAAEERRVAAEQIKALAIKTPTMEQLVLNLSGGNQQKVALAKCLAAQPDVLILMEPTQGIDVGVKFEVYQFIAAQAAAGRSVLLISSELAEILGLAHRILVMREGRITAELDAAQTSQEEILRHALGAVGTVEPPRRQERQE